MSPTIEGLIVGLAWPAVALIGIGLLTWAAGPFMRALATTVGGRQTKWTVTAAGVAVSAEIGNPEPLADDPQSLPVPTGHEPQSIVEGKRVIVNDEKGNTRARLFTTGKDNVVLRLYGEGDKLGLSAGVTRNGESWIQLYCDGKRTVKLHPKGLVLFDAEGTPRFVLHVDSEDTVLGILNAKGDLTWSQVARSPSGLGVN